MVDDDGQTGAAERLDQDDIASVRRAHTQSWSDFAHFLLVTIAGDTMQVRPIGELSDGTIGDLHRYSPAGATVTGGIVVTR